MTTSHLFYSKMVKWYRYRPGVVQRVGRVIAVLLHDCGTSRGWVVSSTPRPHFTPGKDTVPNLREAGWAPGPVWTGGKSRPHRDFVADRPACSYTDLANRPIYSRSYFCKIIFNKAHLLVLFLLGCRKHFLFRPRNLIFFLICPNSTRFPPFFHSLWSVSLLTF